jgi:trehalose 2-sulfotransferase
MITDQFSEKHDMPAPREVLLRYAICSTPRSGSHFLGHLMKEGIKIGHPLEYFHEKHFKTWQKRRESSKHSHMLPYLESIRTTRNGVFGIKIHFRHLQTLEQHIPIRDFIDTYKHVYVLRKNALAQAVSYARASQTEAWISGMPELRKSSYDRLLILGKLRDIYRDNASWECLFSLYQVNFHKVYYEDLVANTNRTLQDVANFLKIEASDVFIPEIVLPKQQSDSINKEWIERFLSETRELNITSTDASVCQIQKTAVSNNQAKKKLAFPMLRNIFSALYKQE